VTKDQYRKDGWPLCPRCDEDELMSLAVAFNGVTGEMRQPLPTDRMRCLRCNWTGVVPVRRADHPTSD
jgi:hypothetical protein